MTCLTTSVFALLVPVCSFDAGVQENVPQLEVLKNYVGQWTLEGSINGSPLIEGTLQSEMILDGRYLQQRLQLHGPDGGIDLKVLFLRTWDVEQSKYRSWSFASGGDSQEWTGVWNEDSRSLTWTAEQETQTITLTSEFSEDGKETWSMISLDEFGNQKVAVEGTNQRKQDE